MAKREQESGTQATVSDTAAGSVSPSADEAAALANLPNYEDPETRRLIKHWSETFGSVTGSDTPVKITEQCLVCGYARDFRGDEPNRKKTCLWHSGHDAEHERRLVAKPATPGNL